MASATVTTADAILKILYPKSAYREIAYKDHPLLALMPKSKDFVGKSKTFPIRFGGNQGRSRVFATAITNAKPGLYEDFQLTRVKDYGITDIDTEAMLASAGQEGAFVALMKSEVDGLLRNLSNNLAMSLYRNFGGARGQIAAGGVAGAVLTLSKVSDVVNFEVGMNLVNSTADGTSGAVGTADQTIVSINRRAGTLTMTAGTNFVAADFLFVKGDFGVAVSGLDSWIPASAPSATLFFQVDRTQDSRLYGEALDGSALTVSECLEYGDTQVRRQGGALSHAFVNPTDFNRLRISLGSQVVYDKVASPDQASISFSTIKMQGQKGPVQIVPDPDCPEGILWGLTLDEWEWNSLGEAPRILDDDGNRVLRVDTADAVRVRAGYYGQLGCHAPAYNVRVILPT